MKRLKNYASNRNWIKRNWGSPNKCENCCKERTNQGDVYWVNKRREISRIREDWLVLCKKCHREYDRKHNNINHTKPKKTCKDCGKRVVNIYAIQCRNCYLKDKNKRIVASNNNGLAAVTWKVLLRDKFTCSICGLQDPEIVQVDHIVRRSKAPELKCVIDNLQTICPNCHERKTRRENRAGRTNTNNKIDYYSNLKYQAYICKDLNKFIQEYL